MEGFRKGDFGWLFLSALALVLRIWGAMKTLTLTHGQTVRGFGFSEHTQQIRVYTVRGYANELGWNPDEAEKHATIQREDLAFTAQTPGIMTSDYAGKSEKIEATRREIGASPILVNGQLVEIEGRVFTVRLMGDQYCDPIKFVYQP
jgi:hypothetical protein